jgi:hypothetical protein
VVHTIGQNGWRLEEFQHYYGNATFDDAGTAVSSQFLLRVYLERRDQRFKHAVHKAIQFVLDAQFKGGVADGGWPQRWPVNPNAISSMPVPNPQQLPPGATQGMEDGDYTTMVTFNDDVAGENIKFLLMCVVGLGETRLVPYIHRAMDCLRRLQQPGPQAGWGLQHLATDRDGRPAGAPAAARSYEPRGLATHTTQTNVQQLFNYFRLTGDRNYLARVPEALDWLETCKLTPQQIAENPLLSGRTHPTYIELGTNVGRFVHRYGSNIWNGAYYHDHDHKAHAQSLLGRAQHQHRGHARHLRAAQCDDRCRGGRAGGALAAQRQAAACAADLLLDPRGRFRRPLPRRGDDHAGGDRGAGAGRGRRPGQQGPLAHQAAAGHQRLPRQRAVDARSPAPST